MEAIQNENGYNSKEQKKYLNAGIWSQHNKYRRNLTKGAVIRTQYGIIQFLKSKYRQRLVCNSLQHLRDASLNREHIAVYSTSIQ